jgi:hypothetical protein
MTAAAREPKLVLIPKSRRYAALRPREVRLLAGATLAIDSGDGRLLCVDARHECLLSVASGGWLSGAVAADVLLDRAKRIPEAGNGWTFSNFQAPVTLPIAEGTDDLFRERGRSNTWSHVASVRLQATPSNRAVIALHERESTLVDREVAMRDLTSLLFVLASFFGTASTLLKLALGDRELLLLEGAHAFARRLGVPRAPTWISMTDDPVIVWRLDGGSRVHAVDLMSPILAPYRVHDDRVEVPVLPVATLAAATRDIQSLDSADPPMGDSVSEHSDSWPLVADLVAGRPSAAGADQSTTAPSALARRTDTGLLVYYPAQRSFESARSRLDVIAEKLTLRSSDKRSPAAFEPPSVLGCWDGIESATERTRNRLAGWIGDKRTGRDTAAIDLVSQTMLRSEVESPLDAAMLDALRRVSPSDLDEREFGSQVGALLVVESELSGLLGGGTDIDADAFADALTAYLVALNTSMAETRGWVWQRIGRYACEYATGRRTATRGGPMWVRLPKSDDYARTRWETLASRIPWLRWRGDTRLDPPDGVPISGEELLDYLALLRPHQYSGSGSQGPIRSPSVRLATVESRWNRLYRLPAGLELNTYELTGLATCLGHLFQDPGHASRILQGLELPDTIRLAAETRVTERIGETSLPENLLAVRVDNESSARVIVANLSPTYKLHLRLGNDLIDLPPSAIENPRATSYCSTPISIDPTTNVILGDQTISLAVPESTLAPPVSVTMPALPPDLFRGRTEQLGRIAHSFAGFGPRAGNLVFGSRRAGKSSLAYQAARDPQARCMVWLDLSMTPVTVDSFRAWNHAITRQLRRTVRNQLALDLQEDHSDLVEAIREIDEEVPDGPPIAMVLDELDVLLLPEQGSEGRRMAARLGNLWLRNIALIGTVQRFHRSADEFKSWQMIECRPDLSWADGITYFFGPLGEGTSGPRVEHLRRAGVTPRLFTSEVYPRLGLRPYFWAQLRSRLDAQVRTHPTGSRLVHVDALRRHLTALLIEDSHLTAVLVDAAEVEEHERRRRDLFSLEERRVLAAFAVMPEGRASLSNEMAERLGGPDAVEELLDRGHLQRIPDGSALTTAVPIYHEFLRARATDLLNVTPGAAEMLQSFANPRANAAATTHNTGTSPPPGVDRSKVVARALEVLVQAIQQEGEPIALSRAGNLLRHACPELPSAGWLGNRGLRRFLERELPQLGLLPGVAGGFVSIPLETDDTARSVTRPDSWSATD